MYQNGTWDASFIWAVLRTPNRMRLWLLRCQEVK
jgi:hypothetical protein